MNSHLSNLLGGRMNQHWQCIHLNEDKYLYQTKLTYQKIKEEHIINKRQGNWHNADKFFINKITALKRQNEYILFINRVEFSTLIKDIGSVAIYMAIKSTMPVTQPN